MTRDEILEFAKDVWGRDKLSVGRDNHFDFYVDLVRAAIAKEREACARVCEETNSASFRETGCPAEGGECAAVIRARGEGLVRKTHQFSNKTIRARGEP